MGGGGYGSYAQQGSLDMNAGQAFAAGRAYYPGYDPVLMSQQQTLYNQMAYAQGLASSHSSVPPSFHPAASAPSFHPNQAS